jgi:protein SCO1/2
MAGWCRTGLALVLVAGAACSGGTRDRETARHPVTGTVVRVDWHNLQLVLAHDAIEGFMPAMTMPFDVANPPAGVQPGDRVKAVLVVRNHSSRLEDLVVIRKAAGPILTMPPSPLGPAVGAEVPDFQLRNQDDEPIRLRQFSGQALLVTFIYTRCPLPDFCPLMMKHLDAINRAVDSRAELRRRVHLLGVSVDPEYDTSEVLRAYGKAFISARDPFERLDLATGDPADVRRMATYFGLSYGAEGAQITHTLSTAIIGVDRRIVALLASNSWRPSDALAAIETHLNRHRP